MSSASRPERTDSFEFFGATKINLIKLMDYAVVNLKKINHIQEASEPMVWIKYDSDNPS